MEQYIIPTIRIMAKSADPLLNNFIPITIIIAVGITLSIWYDYAYGRASQCYIINARGEILLEPCLQEHQMTVARLKEEGFWKK